MALYSMARFWGREGGAGPLALALTCPLRLPLSSGEATRGGAARRVAPSPVLGHLTKIGILTTPLASWRKGRASYFSLLGLISERRSVIGARKFTTSLGGN